MCVDEPQDTGKIYISKGIGLFYLYFLHVNCTKRLPKMLSHKRFCPILSSITTFLKVPHSRFQFCEHNKLFRCLNI